jgi:hypothetical protein
MTEQAGVHLMTNWESFYVILGSSSAALIGLQFVVITLLADSRARRTPTAISAFATPTVVHFSGALVVSAIMSTPWPSPAAAAITLLVCGLIGVGYEARVVVRARRQTAYEPVWEDWLWHVVLPGVAYLALVVAAVLVRRGAAAGFFTVGACALALLLIGIHNAWDTVTYIVVADPDAPATDSNGEE